MRSPSAERPPTATGRSISAATTPSPTCALQFEGRSFELGHRPLVIGREDQADLVIHDPSVSRRHATVALAPAGPTLSDAGSLHGVRVNGARIGRPTVLSHGDRIGILRHEIRFVQSARLMREGATTLDAGVRDRPRSATGHVDAVRALLGAGEEALATSDEPRMTETASALLMILRSADAPTDPAITRRSWVWILGSAARLQRADWVDAVVAAHVGRGEVMSSVTIEALQAALERLPGFDRTALRAYAWTCDARTPYEALCSRRLRDVCGMR